MGADYFYEQLGIIWLNGECNEIIRNSLIVFSTYSYAFKYVTGNV